MTRIPKLTQICRSFVYICLNLLILFSRLRLTQGRMEKGGHRLPKVLLGPAMPDPFMRCGWTQLKWLYGRFRGGHPQGERPAAVFYPLEHPTPYAYALTGNSSMMLDRVASAPPRSDPNPKKIIMRKNMTDQR
jgi:hypothetical protein